MFPRLYVAELRAVAVTDPGHEFVKAFASERMRAELAADKSVSSHLSKHPRPSDEESGDEMIGVLEPC